MTLLFGLSMSLGGVPWLCAVSEKARFGYSLLRYDPTPTISKLHQSHAFVDKLVGGLILMRLWLGYR